MTDITNNESTLQSGATVLQHRHNGGKDVSESVTDKDTVTDTVKVTDKDTVKVTDKVTDKDEVCMRQKKQTKYALFLKSVKFFSVVMVVGFLLSLVFEKVTGENRMYVYFMVGLGVSCLATYYKFRVWADPSYKPDCNCAQPEPEKFVPSTQDMRNGVFTVLGHEKSALLFGIPNTVFGILFYAFMIYINYVEFYLYVPLTNFFTVVSCTGSVYLWYTMIMEIGSVCVICSTIHAVSFLSLFATIRSYC